MRAWHFVQEFRMTAPARPMLFSLMLLAATSVFAQSTKPGLWEIQTRMGGNPQMDQAMAQMQQQMANMPPAQRKLMEDMMAQQGVNIGVGKGGGMSVKVCITPEMAARQELPAQTEGDCKTQITSRTATTLKLSFTCTNPPSSGEGSYTFRGDTGYDMAMRVKTSQNGKPVNTTMDGTGRWLGADCGKVRPVQLPPGK
jgi:hypothetical protein